MAAIASSAAAWARASETATSARTSAIASRRGARLVGVVRHRARQVAVAVGDRLHQVGGLDGGGQAARLDQHQDRIGLAAHVQVAQAAAQQLLAAAQGGLGLLQAGPLDGEPRGERREAVAQRRELGLQARRARAQRGQARLERPDPLAVRGDLAGQDALAGALALQPLLGALEALVHAAPSRRRAPPGDRRRRPAAERADDAPPAQGAERPRSPSRGALRPRGRVHGHEVRIRVGRGASSRVDLEVQVRRRRSARRRCCRRRPTTWPAVDLGAASIQAVGDRRHVGVVVLGAVGALEPDPDAAEAGLGARQAAHRDVVHGDERRVAVGHDVDALVAALVARVAEVVRVAVVAGHREHLQVGRGARARSCARDGAVTAAAVSGPAAEALEEGSRWRSPVGRQLAGASGSS